MMKKLLAILLALAMLLSVSAVFAEGETAEAAEPVVEATPVPDTLLVTVNGQEIRENDESLQEYLSNLLEQIDTSNGDMLRVAQMYAMSYLMQEITRKVPAEEKEDLNDLQEDLPKPRRKSGPALWISSWKACTELPQNPRKRIKPQPAPMR